ncbi:thyrotropin releasing hormone [Phodopus roborovskii]|uniref:Pro-thyrotropin-releasing hormone n=1 Tax=Phodopus roborovskii TaxID=109678 RepID=A0AAV0A5B2_PHORO|nr:thyrotropin releasing hormone [Phodopus roborovskii]CAH7170131.1 Trh [Phodopus roborovskii]
MPGPWLLLSLALMVTLTGIPESCALLEAAQEEGAVTPGLGNVQMRPERRFLRKDLQRVRGDLGAALDSWITKRQHPGKREEEEEIEAEERGNLGGGAWSPHKRQHPGRRANPDKYSWVEAEESNWVPPTRSPGIFLESWYLDQVKRQHPGRRSFPWMESDVTKRQHPGRRFIDPKFQRSWEEKEEGEGVPMSEKRQHPGKRVLGQPCGPQGICGQTDLLQFLGDLSRGQETLEKQSPQLEAWDREPLFED